MRRTEAMTIGAALAVALTAGFAMATDDGESPPADAVAHRDVTYATTPTGPVKLDVFTPPGDGPFPLIVWIHGGAWRLGDKAAWPHMNPLVGDGFAVANVEYRFSPVAPFPAQRDDCLAALDFLAAHAADYHVDANRIAVAGESAGGHLASLVGLARSSDATSKPAGGRVRAVIDLFGPSDLAALATSGSDAKLVPDLEQLLGGPLASHAALERDASPIAHVAKDAPPFLILHGTKDPLVPFAQSEHFADALKAAGATVTLLPVEGAGHAGPEFWTVEIRAKMLAFLRTILK